MLGTVAVWHFFLYLRQGCEPASWWPGLGCFADQCLGGFSGFVAQPPGVTGFCPSARSSSAKQSTSQLPQVDSSPLVDGGPKGAKLRSRGQGGAGEGWQQKMQQEAVEQLLQKLSSTSMPSPHRLWRQWWSPWAVKSRCLGSNLAPPRLYDPGEVVSPP